MTADETLPSTLPPGWKRYEPGDFLTTPQSRTAYLDLAMQEDDGDGSVIAAALGVIARAYGMSALAVETGLTRPALYKALDTNGNPTLKTILATLHAMGLRLSVRPENVSAAE